MSETTPAATPPLSVAEIEDFRALGLRPGYWEALAPVPLFRADLRKPEARDFHEFHMLRVSLRTIPQPEAEAEQFWSTLSASPVGGEVLTIASALLGWHLATGLIRERREGYLAVLDRAVEHFRPRSNVAPRPPVVRDVRKLVEAHLPSPVYLRCPGVPRLSPPSAIEVAQLFGPDLWKQMLAALVAAALADRNAHPSDVLHVARRLANVTESGHSRTYPLEPHLHAGWRQLFDGLLNPVRRADGDLLIEQGMDVAARGLASLGFEEREQILTAIQEELSHPIGWGGHADGRDGGRPLESWIGQLREKVETILWQVRSQTSIPTTPQVSIAPSVPGPSPPEESRPTVALAIPLKATVTLPPPLVVPARKTGVTVETASPFTMVTFDEALAAAAEVTVAEIREWLEKPDRPGLLFDDQREECKEVVIVRDSQLVPRVLWVIGDVHADVLTLANVIAHAERVARESGEPPAFLFLGDFVDRGRHDHETLLLLFQLIMKAPGRVCVIPGNHDVDLQWSEKNGRFVVTIEPAEYCEKLNADLSRDDPESHDHVELARLLIPFWQGRPKAVILPDGTLLAHAGFPHSDTFAMLRTAKDLDDKRCVNDFLWARIAETARKRPNRGNRGHEFGWETFAQFCKLSPQIGIPRVQRLVRGHDHVPNRWQYYPDYADNPVLTINAMSRRMDGELEPTEGPHPFPVMARHVPNQLPIVVRLPLDPREVDRAFGSDRSKMTDPASLPRDEGTDGSGSPSVTEGSNVEKTADAENEPPFPLGILLDDCLGGIQLDTMPQPHPRKVTETGTAGGV